MPQAPSALKTRPIPKAQSLAAIILSDLVIARPITETGTRSDRPIFGASKFDYAGSSCGRYETQRLSATLGHRWSRNASWSDGAGMFDRFERRAHSGADKAVCVGGDGCRGTAAWDGVEALHCGGVGAPVSPPN